MWSDLIPERNYSWTLLNHWVWFCSSSWNTDPNNKAYGKCQPNVPTDQITKNCPLNCQRQLGTIWVTLVIDFGKRLAIDYNTLTDHSRLGVWGFPTRGLAPLGWVSASPSASATVQLPRQLGLTIVLGKKKIWLQVPFVCRSWLARYDRELQRYFNNKSVILNS